MFQINNMTQMSCNFREQCKIVRMGGIPLKNEPNQTSPPARSPPSRQCLGMRIGGSARGECLDWPYRLAVRQGGGRGVNVSLYLINGLMDSRQIWNEGSQ